MPLFNRYLFADYSGVGEDAAAHKSIRLYEAQNSGASNLVPTGNPRSQNFRRDSLRLKIRQCLDEANQSGERVIFGQSHQYGWPPYLRALAGLNTLSWQDGLRLLATGLPSLPALDIPKRYCREFNQAVGQNAFWSPQFAATYGIPKTPPKASMNNVFRLTELVARLHQGARLTAANAVGGRASNIVADVAGGPTICGLKQLALMLEWDDVAWWPFDGLDINNAAYQNKHVAVEICPTLLRPKDVPINDAITAYHSVLYTREADQQGQLPGLLDLSNASPQQRTRIQLEGWIMGTLPSALPADGSANPVP